jgi:putative tricarboxylic transport membrane protein
MELSVALSSLVNLVSSPMLMGLMLLSVPIGTFFGVVPGLGGKLGIVLVIPFIYGMDQVTGAVFLLGMHAVVHTGGAVPSILFNVPANGPEAATLLDGFPLTKMGKAGRALGASLTASGVGGIIGAVAMALMLPLIEPIVLSFSPAEFFLLALFGITFIATLAGEAMVPGIIVGLFGLMVACIGQDPQTGTARYAFGQLWLWDGVDIITAVLGMFAVPEMLELGLTGNPIASGQGRVRYSYGEVFQGILDVFRHWGLTIRTSLIGFVIGMIPGLGGECASWMCYGHAVQTSKHPERFGKGAIEGVIAPETANNAKEGGALLPTLFFGVPGSSGMAILLGAFVMLGIKPGPMMVVNELPLVWTLVWALVISNVLCSLMLLVAARWFGMVSSLPARLLVPIVFLLTMVGCYVSKGHWENFIVLLALGGLGYLFKRCGWPRPPFVIGLVLGSIAEQSLHKAINLWGYSFLARPLSLVLIALIVASVVWHFMRPKAGKPVIAYDA